MKLNLYNVTVKYATHSGINGPAPSRSHALEVSVASLNEHTARDDAIKEAYRLKPDEMNHAMPVLVCPVADPILATLYRARAVIALEKDWAQGCSARDALGDECPAGALDCDAIKWCMFGAVELAAMELDTNCGENVASICDLLLKAQRYAWPNPHNVEYRNVADFNDDPVRTHAQVLKCFTVAIEHRVAALVQ